MKKETFIISAYIFLTLCVAFITVYFGKVIGSAKLDNLENDRMLIRLEEICGNGLKEYETFRDGTFKARCN